MPTPNYYLLNQQIAEAQGWTSVRLDTTGVLRGLPPDSESGGEEVPDWVGRQDLNDQLVPDRVLTYVDGVALCLYEGQESISDETELSAESRQRLAVVRGYLHAH